MEKVLGINGLGRIGKMSVWHNIARGYYDRLVVNLGRKAGKRLSDLANYIAYDSTYGALHNYVDGHAGKMSVEVVSEAKNELRIHGVPVTVLCEHRNPKEINWRDEGVGIVAETTGVFRRPHDPEDAKGGSLRGHLAAGAELVVLSTAFKTSPEGLPDDSIFLVYGANHHEFQSMQHKIVSAASCTTTALAHMLLPLLNASSTARLVTAGMSTVHATTNTQSILDSVPKAGTSDMRRNRSVLNNTIITTTNAAKALEWVIPEVKDIGFLADSVRIPTDTVSLIILNVTFQTELDSEGNSCITRDVINDIFRNAMEHGLPNIVEYTESQNVSGTLKGRNAAVVIEGSETHTRTGFLSVVLPDNGAGEKEARIPVTHGKIFGWYDNELGSYTNRFGDLVVHLDENL